MTILRIEHRFRGPARSGNGGYAAGAFAQLVSPDPVEVVLRRPPPLETDLSVEDGTLSVDGVLVAEARPLDDGIDPVEPVSPDEAEAATTRYPGLLHHPFPSCFGCGPERTPGDGLRIFPGPVGDDRVAATWTPDSSLPQSSGHVDAATTWAALDCVGGWSCDMEGRPAVLGTMAALLDSHPALGEPHVVVGRALRRDGRRTHTASTLYDAEGRVVARARHVWVEVDPALFN